MISRRCGWLVLFLVACGSALPSLTREERERLPMDGRQEIFDAENDVIIARNRADLARDQLQAIEDALDRLDDRLEQNEKRLAAQPATKGHASHLRKVFQAEEAYLEARKNVATAEVEVAAQETAITRSRLHLVIQRQLVRIGKAPVGSLEGYEKRIAEAEAKGKQTRTSSLDLRTKAQTLLDTWKNAQAQYATQTNDFNSGIWLE